MKKNDDLQENVHGTRYCDPILNERKSALSKASLYLRKIILVMVLAGSGILLNSCLMGYVASEPSYVEYSRPSSPNTQYIWIEGDWGWNNQTHVYVQKTGYWEKPRPSQTYVSGHWQQSPKGKSWSKGYWQKNKNGKSDNRREK